MRGGYRLIGVVLSIVLLWAGNVAAQPALEVCQAPNAALPMTTTTVSTLEAPGGFTITELNVPLVLTHPRVGSLKIRIESPAGTSVLLTRPGGGENMDCIYSDVGHLNSNRILAGSFPSLYDCGGCLMQTPTQVPVGPSSDLTSLADFEGEDAGGVWSLKVENGAIADGILHEWCILGYDIEPVTDLVCSPVSGEPGMCEISWINGADYDTVRIYHWGELLADSSDTFLVDEPFTFRLADPLPVPAVAAFRVVGVVSDIESAPNDCEVALLAAARECAGAAPSAEVTEDGPPFVGFATLVDPGTIGDISVNVDVHGSTSDLKIFLTSHTGTSVSLANPGGVNATALTSTFWELGAPYGTQLLASGVTMQPDDPATFRDLIGEEAVGATGEGLFALLVTQHHYFIPTTVESYELCVYDVTPALAPSDVTCTSGDAVGSITLTWTNTTDYDSVRIFLNGAIIDSVTGGFTAGETASYTTAPQPLGLRASVAVQGVLANGAPGRPVGCALMVTAPPVADLACMADNAAGVAVVTWTIVDPGVPYDFYNVYHDGVLAGTIEDGTVTVYETTAGDKQEELVTVGIQGVMGDFTSEIRTCATLLLPPADLEVCSSGSASGTSVISAIEISDALTIGDVEVVLLGRFQPRRTTVVLRSPDGTAITLHRRVGPFPNVSIPVVLRFKNDGVPIGQLGAGAWDDGVTVKPYHIGGFTPLVNRRTGGTWELEATTSPPTTVWIDEWCLRVNGCPPFPPDGLTCARSGDASAELSWRNGDYDELRVYRNETLIEVLPGDATSYTASGLEAGRHYFEVAGWSARDDCEVRSRRCRTAIGFATACVENLQITLDTPTPIPIPFFEPLVIGRVEVTFEATFPESAHRPVSLTSPFGTEVQLARTELTTVDLVWSDAPDAGPGGPPYDCNGCLKHSQTGSLSAFAGEIADGDWQLTIEHASGAALERFCIDVFTDCLLLPPGALTCTDEGNILLEWTNSDLYERIRIERNDQELVADLPGDETSYIDVAPPNGTYDYRVFGISEDGACESGSTHCVIHAGVFTLCDETNFPIPPESAITVAQTVAGPVSVDEAEVTVDINGTWVPNLGIAITNPGGTEVTLYAGRQPLGSVGTHMRCTFAADGAEPPFETYYCPDCRFLPDGPGQLEDFAGQDPEGDWSLTVSSSGDDAEIWRWCIALTGTCPLPRPRVVHCAGALGDNVAPIILEWEGTEDASAITILRDGVAITELGGDAAQFADEDPVPARCHVYEVIARSDSLHCAERSRPCEVSHVDRYTRCSDGPVSADGPALILDVIDWTHEGIGDAVAAGDLEGSILAVQVELRATTLATAVEVYVISPGGTSVLITEESADTSEWNRTYADPGAWGTDENNGCDTFTPVAGPGTLADFEREDPAGDWALLLDQHTGTITMEQWCVGVYVRPNTPIRFLRGDVNDDGKVSTLIDALRLLNWGFRGGPAPSCLAAADVDGGGTVAPLIDALRLLRWGFTGGAAPPLPGPDTCGTDPDLSLTGGLTDTEATEACETASGHGDGCAP